LLITLGYLISDTHIVFVPLEDQLVIL